jgi:glycolate oxidase
MDAAAETVSAIIAAKIIPCTLEFLDSKTIRCVEDYAHVGLPLDAEALLLIEVDGHPAAVADEAARILELCPRRNGAPRCGWPPRRGGRALATARRSAFSALARVKPTTILEDATVPRSELAGMIRFIQETAPSTGSTSPPSATSGTATSTPPSSPTSGTRTRCTGSSSR